jgi:hypothetical protein
VSAILLSSSKRPPGTRRSPKWPSVRRHFLVDKVCAVCGGRAKLEAHHIVPFHLDPARELDPANLIALCEGRGVNCHLLFGHLGDFASVNTRVRDDAATWGVKLRMRP